MEFDADLNEWPESAELIEVLNAKPPKSDRCYTMPGIKLDFVISFSG